MTATTYQPLPDTWRQAQAFPTTRLMGSKRRLLPQILGIVESLRVRSCVDMFSGSGVVAYGLKAAGLQTFANDYMAMAATTAVALVENSDELLELDEVELLLEQNSLNDGFVQRTYSGLYYSDSDNLFIDTVRANTAKLRSPYKRALATACLIRSCMKKRPRGLFSYVGHRYDDGRRDLAISFADQFRLAAQSLNHAVFSNGQLNQGRRGDALESAWDVELAYVDPPYYSMYSDNEYVRRYHFVEGIACDWQGVEFQWHTKTRKFKSYPTPFSSRVGAAVAFDSLFSRFSGAAMIVSYSSNSLPTKLEMVSLLKRFFSRVDVVETDYTYSFGTQGQRVADNNNDAQEYLFVAER